MTIRLGDTIMFNYVPSQIKKLPKCGYVTTRGIVKKLLRKDNIALVSVWNGRVDCPVRDQYELIEVSLDEATFCAKRKRRKRKKKE